MKYTYENIISSMKNAYESTVGAPVNRGSDEEKQLEAVASQLFSLSCYGDYIKEQAFVQTATGEYLDKHGELRGVERKPGSTAIGELCFYISEASAEDIVINEGTVCSVEGQPLLQYVTTESAVLPAGETQVLVSAEAIAKGKKFNTAENTITVMVNAPIGIERVSNPAPFSCGYDGESDTDYRSRIIESFTVPTVFMSLNELENRILQDKDIIDCKILGCDEPNKFTIVYRTIYDIFMDSLREEYGDELAGEIYNMINERIVKAVGITELLGTELNIVVAQPEIFDIDFTVKLFDISDEAVRDEVMRLIKKHFDAERVGECISLAKFRKELYTIDGFEEVIIGCDKIVEDYIYCPSYCYLTNNGKAVHYYE